MNHQKTTQITLATPSQPTEKPHQKLEKMAFFDESGNAVDIVAVFADFESRIATLEGA